MSAVVNARDVLLQAASPRTAAVNLPTNVSVDTVNIKDNAVTTTKIVDAAVSTAKFAIGIEPVSIVSSLPSPSGYTGPKTVFLTTDNKLYRHTGSAWTVAVPTTDLTGQVTTAQITDSAVTTAKIVDAAVSTAKFASGIEPVSIVGVLPSPAGYTGPKTVFLTTDNKLYRYTGSAWTTAVPTGDLTGQITTTQITDAAISTPKLAANAVTATEIATDAVTANKIIAGAVTTAKLAASAVTANEIAADAVTAAKILAGAVTTGKLAAGAVTANEIAVDAVTAAKILAGSVTTAKLAANAVTATEIATDAVTANKIIAGAVTTAKLAASAVTANEIAANAVTASKILAGTITTDRLVANAATVAAASANSTSLFTPAATDTTVVFMETGGIVLTSTGSPVKYLAAIDLVFICGTGVDYMSVQVTLNIDGTDTTWQATEFVPTVAMNASHRRGQVALPLVGRETPLSGSHAYKAKASVSPYDSSGVNVQWGGDTRSLGIQSMVIVEENKV